MTLFAWLVEGLERPTVRTFYGRVADDRILDDGQHARTFEKDKGYFEIRLAELYLRNRGELLRNFVPMGVVACAFRYGDTDLTVPFVVSGEALQEALNVPVKNKSQYIEIRNSLVAGPIPYRGRDVGVFVGLYRTEVSAFTKSLFGLVDRVATAFDLANLSSYLKVGEILRDSLRDVLGMEAVEFCFGTHDVFEGAGTSPQRFRSGYLAYVNAAENTVDGDRLWVRNGRLHEGADAASLNPFGNHDYCLVKINHLPNRDDFNRLSFHDHWRAAQDMIWTGQIDKARLFGLPELAKAVAQSADLIDDDKTVAMATYMANFHREVERWRGANEPEIPISPTRGRRSTATSATNMLRKAAGNARVALSSDDVSEALNDLATHAPKIPSIWEGGQRIDLDLRLPEQLSALRAELRQPSVDPDQLATAIALDAADTVRQGIA